MAGERNKLGLGAKTGRNANNKIHAKEGKYESPKVTQSFKTSTYFILVGRKEYLFLFEYNGMRFNLYNINLH